MSALPEPTTQQLKESMMATKTEAERKEFLSKLQDRTEFLVSSAHEPSTQASRGTSSSTSGTSA